MATQTPYFGLTKSGGTEAALIGVYNNNMDIIDLEIWQSMVRAAINLAPIYDETAAYVEGDYCTLLETIQQTVTGFHLYKCTTDTTDPAGTFDPNSWSEVNITSEMGHGGGGGGGHIYLDNSGNVMTQRTKAKFEGAYTTDNGTNDITNVAVMRSMHHADFEQLSDAEKQGIIFVDDETGAVEDKFQPVIYSEDEREIGVWTDGKPLYEKTIIADNLSSGDNTILHGISDLDVIASEKSVLWYNNDSFVPLPAISTSSGWSSRTRDFSSTSYVVEIGSAAAAYADKCYTTLQYTKTTDQTGSGQWTPQGVPTVHYSTDEKVVGTWIDGSTIYEKTINFGALPNANTKQVNHSISDIDFIWIADGFANNPTSGFTQQLNMSGLAIGDQFTFGVNKTYVQCITNSNRSAYTNCFVTVRYIKSSS